MTNGEWMVKNGYKFSDVCLKGSYDTIAIFLNGKQLGKVRGTYSSAFQQWLDMEHKEPILDDAEKRYLSAVIRPFKFYVWHIRKVNSEKKYGYQKIVIDMFDDSEPIVLPLFKKDTMYKGMEVDHFYKLDELGIE